jgi:hypothetical protein
VPPNGRQLIAWYFTSLIGVVALAAAARVDARARFRR